MTNCYFKKQKFAPKKFSFQNNFISKIKAFLPFLTQLPKPVM